MLLLGQLGPLLNVVGESRGWVHGWIAEKLAIGLDCWRIQQPIIGTNIYVPYYFLQHKTPKDIALFTHYPPDPYNWERAADLADVCLAMSNHSAERLPPDKTIVVKIPPDPQFRKDKIVLGISGRDYRQHGDSRKCLEWMDKLLAIPGIEVKYTGGLLPWVEMPAWYASIDYLLVLSDNEGGPMGVVEAIAAGKPVIAPDVGWAWDYPVLRYAGWLELEKIVKGLTTPPDQWDMTIDRIRALC